MSDPYASSTSWPIGRSYYAALVPFAETCFVGCFLTDLAYWASDSIIWETFSVWLLVAGLLIGGLAIVAGIVDLARSRSVRGLEQPLPAVFGHAVAFALSLVNVFVHSRDGYTAVVPQGLLLSVVVVLVLAAVAWTGRSNTSRRRAGDFA